MLRGLVAIQAVCMILLASVVIMKMLPIADADPSPKGGDKDVSDDGGNEPGSPGGEQDLVLATINGQPITLGELQAKLARLYGESTLRTMMVQRAVDLEALETNLEVSAAELEEELARMAEGYTDEEHFYRTMEEQLGMDRDYVREDTRYRLLLEKIAVRMIPISDERVQSYIDDHPEEFGPREELRISWIVTDEEDEALTVLKLLSQGQRFDKLASQYSTDGFTADYGGDMGYIAADDPFVEPAVLDLARSLPIGEIAGPIGIYEGYAVIAVTERKSINTPSGRHLFERVRKQLALAAARPLKEIEDSLLRKYGAEIVQPR